MTTKSRLRLSGADHGTPLTHEELAEAFFEEPWRYERVNGRLNVMSPSGQDHVDSTEPFLEQLITYKLTHPGRVSQVVPEAWIVIDARTDRIADLGVYLKPSGKDRIPDLIPEIIIEVASEGYTSLKQDYEEKRVDYERAGVREYLIVDRFDHRVTVFRRSRNRFVQSTLGPEDTYTTPLLPGLKVPLKGIV